MKVKIFSDSSRQTLESDIQRFFDGNPGITIINVQYAMIHSEYHDNSLCSALIRKKKTKKLIKLSNQFNLGDVFN